ncbi:reverse transcriptase domain-containing protein [Tanacetum coccineum]|uniref:Reverse transcriptase domain-containing protein n=1 Tax=Tanacetum coccineum TaxID=301880 RepID=A0ABQ5I3W5_9ASTR
MLKFPVEGGTVTLQSSRVIPMECAMISGPSIQSPAVNQVLEKKKNIAIHPEYPEQTVAIGSTLTEKERKELCSLLKQNLDNFAWKPADMTGVPRNIAEHSLNIREGYSPVRQKKRGQAPERNKHDGTWRMCVDFKDLNNACPKDCYPLPEIDWKVESLCRYPFKCFLDAYKGYHQIKMAKEDEEKTAFITSQGIFCYSKMPFDLKNVGSTYQRLVDKAFQRQIGRNLEVYIDDVVIKSRTEEEIIRDITETFKTLRQINMKLNPKKCTFGMQEGMFLGYKVSTNGLRACPDKADTVLSLPSPRCIKDVQKLNGKLASLNRFLSKSAEKSLPFFKTLKKCTKKSDFQWTPEAEEAFKQMKKLIAELPTLTAPKEHEELIIYLAAAKEAISAILMTDREGRQIPVYFISRTLRGPKVNYTPMEKLVLALLSASKRLKRYFQAHTVVVITDQPIKQLLSSSEISGRMLKWKFELEGYDIQYRPRTAIKGQILADFIVERPEEGSPDKLMAEPEVLPEPWTLFTDGSSCIDGSGAGLILTNPEGAEFTYVMRFRFEATNNEAEYKALIAGLRIAEQMGVKNLQAHVDSRFVANQVNSSYIAKESGMVQYLNKVKTIAKSFNEFSIKQIPRSENKKADALSKIASTSFAYLSKQVLVEELKEKSINEKEILNVVEEEGNTWMTPICEYLAKEILSEDKKKDRAVRRKAARYTMINGTLYKKYFLGPWLWCVRPLQANYVLREIHEGSCSMHSGPRSVVAKVIRTGYYWPTMHMDARNLIRECNDCQIHRPVPRNPQQNLTPITSPWPFYKWGIDIAGPFPEGPGKVKFLIVAIDYFTKWIEAKAVATITGNQVKKFVWDNIVCRFGLPGEIISDNGKQFRDNPFKDWCEKLCIRQCFASVKHPQANGLVERANRSLGEGIKARLDERSKDWIEELPHVLWAHRTMIKSSNGETPFSLTYGTEAVIPAEIGMPTLRTTDIDLTKNNEALEMNLDLIEERREQAAIQEAKSKKKMEKYYNSRVRGTSFKPGDMVYRSNEASHARDEGKLGPKWEGPYEVKESLGKGAYKLKDCKGNEMPRTWNICNLKKCYIHEV